MYGVFSLDPFTNGLDLILVRYVMAIQFLNVRRECCKYFVIDWGGLVVLAACFDDHSGVLGSAGHCRVEVEPPGRIPHDEGHSRLVASVRRDGVPETAVIQEYGARDSRGMNLRGVRGDSVDPLDVAL